MKHRHRAARRRRRPARVACLIGLASLLLATTFEPLSQRSLGESVPLVAQPREPDVGYVLGSTATPATSAPLVGTSLTTQPPATATSGRTPKPSAPREPSAVARADANSPAANVLIVSTPYTADHPFTLGMLLLSPVGTGLVGSSCLGCSGDGITITDTRPGSRGWSASAQTSDFHSTAGNGPTIDGDGLVLDHLVSSYPAGHTGAEPVVQTYPIDHFKNVKRRFASTTTGPGTVTLRGELQLTAPTSTPAGTYTATITVTVV
jgi:hypothetical protein